MNEFKLYNRFSPTLIRPYVEGEHIEAFCDHPMGQPKKGDYIAKSPHNDIWWHMSGNFFRKEYELITEWQRTMYGHKPPVKCPMENGKYYEIGFYNEHQKEFSHQGIRMFKDGFMDDNMYPLKPFPTHFKEVVLSIPKPEKPGKAS